MKYKINYVSLKSQLGGDNKYVMLSDINNETKYLRGDRFYLNFINDELKKYEVGERKTDPIYYPDLNNNKVGFYQDQYIIFNSIIDGEPYAIQVFINPYNFPDGYIKPENIFYRPEWNLHENDLAFGGNFIASPSQHILYFNTPNDYIPSYLIEHIKSITDPNNLIELKCSFTYGNDRHIDECCCFMPYGGEFKIWIYEINEVKFVGEDAPIIKYNLELDEIIDELKKIKEKADNDINNIFNIRTAFFRNIAIKNVPIKLKEIEYLDYLITHLESIKEGLESKIKNIKNDWEFIKKTLKNDILFYNLRHVLTGILPPIIKHLNLDTFKSELLLEQIDNYNLISNKLFGVSDHHMVIDKFVFFPINIGIDKNDNCYIIDITTDESGNDITKQIPGVFNRLWIENEQQTLAVFSKTLSSIHREILNREKEKMKSMLYPTRDIKYLDIDINNEFYHIKSQDLYNPGGSVHCLIKQLH